MQDYDEAIHLNTQYIERYYNRSVAYVEVGKKAEAISDYEKIITRNDNPQWIEMTRQ